MANLDPGKKIKVAVVIFEGVELVDMNGPIDVFLHTSGDDGAGLYEISTVALTDQELLSEYNAITIKPKYSIDNYPGVPDIVVIPGKLKNGQPDLSGIVGQPLTDWIAKQGQNGHTIVMSVCIGAFILKNTGLLNGKKATTHYLAIEDLEADKFITVIKNVRYVQDENMVTTGGITSGIDGALYLVEQRFGTKKAQGVADILVYNMNAPLPPDTILPLHQTA